MKGQIHHTFIMAKSASVTRVARNPNNKQGCIVSLSNGDTLWLQTTYVQSVLESNFIDDMRPTALQGAEVSYEVRAVKAGDLVINSKGEVNAGETLKYTKDRDIQVNIRFGAVEGHVAEFDKARMQAAAIGKALASVAHITAPKAFVPAAKAVEQEQPALDTTTIGG